MATDAKGLQPVMVALEEKALSWSYRKALEGHKSKLFSSDRARTRFVEIVGSVDVIGFVVDARFVFNSLLVVFLKKKKEMMIKMHELVLQVFNFNKPITRRKRYWRW
ncbi:hypothetical protein P8452_55027 [Trifolium repens]|nr:hypothetical protein P8452_55027 [Trifolium repens]